MKYIKLRKALLALVIAMSIFGSAVAFGGCAQPLSESGADGEFIEEETSGEDETTEEETESSEETEESAEEEISYQVDPDQYECEMIRTFIIENSSNEFLVFEDLGDSMIDDLQEGIHVTDLATEGYVEFLKFDSKDTAMYQCDLGGQDITENDDGTSVFEHLGDGFIVRITVYPDGLAVREYITGSADEEEIDTADSEEIGIIDEELELTLDQYKTEKIREYIREHVYDEGVSMMNTTEYILEYYSDNDDVQGIEEVLAVYDDTNNTTINFTKFDTFEHAMAYISPVTGIEMTEMPDGSVEFTIGPEGTDCEEAYGTIDTDGLVTEIYVVPD